MTTWPVMTLGEAGVSLIDCVHKTPKAQAEGYPYVGIPQMKSGHIAFQDARLISLEDYEEWTKKAKPQPDDVILSRRTNPGVIAVDKTNTPFALGQNLVLLRSDGTKVYPPFLRWLCLSREWWDQIEKFINVGAVFSSLRCADVPKFELPVPSMRDQEEIAGLLGALDDKIELNRRMSATLEEMARALYRSWFVDFDPVHARALGQPPALMDPTTAALFPDSFGPDGLPKGWERKRLGDFLTLNYGKALKRSLREPGQYPVYGSGGTDTTHALALVSEPTIIVGRKGTVGSVMWEPNGCWPIDTTFYVTSGLSMSFILRTLQALPLADMNTDAAVPGLNRENAYRLEVPMPQENVLSAFDEMAATWQSKIDHAATENRILVGLRDSLLPRLMSGDLRIRETKQQVEEVV